ncbi:MAG: shikimate dehydrogenase [Rhodobacteraceae bacterium]|nr:shikimate dehydrogenase [Paracoccaceae bacterium]MBR9822519.1 shikimate dehydrogenase [Paracoccaceae bacterium]
MEHSAVKTASSEGRCFGGGPKVPQDASARVTVDCNAPVRIGLLGQGIAASRTPRMHMAAAAALGLPYDYRLIDSQRRDLPADAGAILDMLEAEGFSGLNVTYPFKRTVIPAIDVLSDAARNVGAVNTVVFRDGKRFGHNTDHWGFGESLRQGLPEASLGRVVLVGAGGAGGAVAHALLDAGVGTLLVADLSDAMARDLTATLAERYGAERAEAVTDLPAAIASADGMVNATPMGMDKHPGMPVAASDLRPELWVGDIVYFPLETELLRTARALGCRVLPGSGMALYQAARAFRLFTGLEPDTERMWEAFRSFDPGRDSAPFA